jgi:hypothetical protein
MTTWPLDIPLLRASAWFEQAPAVLSPGADGFLDLASGKPDVAFVEPMQRRRLSPLARAFFHCANRIAPPGDVRLVFASRHGEAERTLGILHDLAAGAEASPTLFSTSVHNAVPGLWSILRGSRAGINAVAAGPETFGWGLVEALAAYRADPSGPVLYVYADDRLPDPWAGPVPPGALHAVALLLGEPAERRLRLARSAGEQAEPAEPQSIHCLQALGGGGSSPWAGPGGTWQWFLES